MVWDVELGILFTMMFSHYNLQIGNLLAEEITTEYGPLLDCKQNRVKLHHVQNQYSLYLPLYILFLEQ